MKLIYSFLSIIIFFLFFSISDAFAYTCTPSAGYDYCNWSQSYSYLCYTQLQVTNPRDANGLYENPMINEAYINVQGSTSGGEEALYVYRGLQSWGDVYCDEYGCNGQYIGNGKYTLGLPGTSNPPYAAFVLWQYNEDSAHWCWRWIGYGWTGSPLYWPVDIVSVLQKNANFGIAATPLYSISGKLFSDTNGDGKSVGDSNYPGTFSVSSSTGTVSYPGNGTYQITGINSGPVTVTFSGLPSGDIYTYPTSSLLVNVGTSCSAPVTSEGTCSLGNILDLNAGVTALKDPWFQSKGSDMRIDTGFTIDHLPSSSAYASIPNAPNSLMPGIIFSGKTTPLLSPGQASLFRWQVGTPTNPNIFTVNHSTIPTSYNFLLKTAENAGITPVEIIGSTLSTTVTQNHNIYKTTGDVSITSATTFGSGDFIILVNGDLSIDENITVPPGSTVIFSASGDIVVCPTCSTSIQGIYSADGSFIVQGISDLPTPGSCPTQDITLNIEGAVIANAARNGGAFINHRSLCAGNSTTPVITFTERPSFLIYYPDLIKQTNRVWQELAP
jgi:hypothetical protein